MKLYSTAYFSASESVSRPLVIKRHCFFQRSKYKPPEKTVQWNLNIVRVTDLKLNAENKSDTILRITSKWC